MAVVTELKYQKNKSRANVYLDGVFCCGLEVATIMKNAIKVGTEISSKQLENIQAESELERATEKALSLLERQKYTKKQIKDKLKLKGYLPATIDKVVEKLENYGYISDENYAESYIRSINNKSKKEIRFMLQSKGVSAEKIEKAIEESNFNEEETVFKLAEKFMKYKEPTPENKVKLVAYLYRKGFSYEDINKIKNRFSVDFDEF